MPMQPDRRALRRGSSRQARTVLPARTMASCASTQLAWPGAQSSAVRRLILRREGKHQPLAPSSSRSRMARARGWGRSSTGQASPASSAVQSGRSTRCHSSSPASTSLTVQPRVDWPGLVNRLAAAGDEIVPLGQRRPPSAGGRRRSTAAIPARRAWPVELDAIGDQLLAVGIIGALAGAAIEQLAGDIGREQLAGVVILELVQAAAPATVAQRFPFAAVERRQGLFPKGFCAIHG